jgi:hypothetical protein
MEQGQRPGGADRIGCMNPDEVEREVGPGQHDRGIVPGRTGRECGGSSLALQLDEFGELLRGRWRRLWRSQLVTGGQQPGAPRTRRPLRLRHSRSCGHRWERQRRARGKNRTEQSTSRVLTRSHATSHQDPSGQQSSEGFGATGRSSGHGVNTGRPPRSVNGATEKGASLSILHPIGRSDKTHPWLRSDVEETTAERRVAPRFRIRDS